MFKLSFKVLICKNEFRIFFLMSRGGKKLESDLIIFVVERNTAEKLMKERKKEF